MIKRLYQAGGPDFNKLSKDEGAPGPSLLGTGDIDTMQALASTRTPDTSRTPPYACLLSAASAHPSISTGKERDTESGNDYFGARYYLQFAKTPPASLKTTLNGDDPENLDRKPLDG